jgi:hypothetical protein
MQASSVGRMPCAGPNAASAGHAPGPHAERGRQRALQTGPSARLKTPQAHDRAKARCARKDRHESGTRVRSFEAFCGAALAQFDARRLKKAGADRKQP